MTLNDMRTLRSKMDLMSRSAMKVAEFLEAPSAGGERPVPGAAEPPAARSGQKIYVAGGCGIRRAVRQAGQPLRPSAVVLREGRGGEGPRSSSTPCSGSGGRPTWGGSRASPPYPPSPRISSRARRHAHWPTSPPTWSASAWAPNIPTTSSPTWIRRCTAPGSRFASQLISLRVCTRRGGAWLAAQGSGGYVDGGSRPAGAFTQRSAVSESAITPMRTPAEKSARVGQLYS